MAKSLDRHTHDITPTVHVSLSQTVATKSEAQKYVCLL